MMSLLVLFSSGCSTAGNKADVNAAAGNAGDMPPPELNTPDLTDEYGGRDSLEPFNRSMLVFNKYAWRYFVQPIAIFWGSLIPKHGIECFNRFTENVAFPKRTFSSLFQAKFKYAGLDFSRFLINITLGIAGFYDPALKWFDMEKQDEDFGQAFAVWGIGDGPSLHLPLMGQTNLRDGVGTIFDYAFDPKTYIYGGQGFTILNESTYKYREMDVFMRANKDPYELAKRFYAFERYIKINDYDRKERMNEYMQALFEQDNKQFPSPETDPVLQQIVIRGFKSQGGHIDTLRLGMVDIGDDHGSWWVDTSLWNTDFYNKGYIRSVEVIKGKSDMPYKIWYQKNEDAPLAIVLPGFGAHYTSVDGTAISKILFDKGYTVVFFASAMNWEFMDSASSAAVPGYPPIDASDIREAIAAVVKKLEGKGLRFPAKIITGYSLGGMHALYIGAMEKKEPRLKIDRIVALNPPVSLLNAITVIDELGHAWKKWPQDKVFERTAVAAAKYISIAENVTTPYVEPEEQPGNGEDLAMKNDKPNGANGKTAKPGEGKETSGFKPLPFTDTEAQVLISYNFMITLDELIMEIVKKTPSLNCFTNTWTWGDRTYFYRESNQFSFMDYYKKFMVKYLSEKENRQVPMEEIERNASLVSIGAFLKDDPNVFVIHSSNDFLQDKSERQWLKNTMGARCIFYNVGGHLGDLSLVSLQNRFAALAEELKKKTDAAKDSSQK
ncbi:MAG: hypothetical protein A2X48_20630 [Lentisphaerae bacterium GWF2_49_21]|nr:MAG: hypothetical protein A2X48_20630 [Lentisphaerae bacterium GWF2_49_21]